MTNPTRPMLIDEVGVPSSTLALADAEDEAEVSPDSGQ